MAKIGFYVMLLLPKKTMTIIVLFYLDMLTQPLVKYERPLYVAFFFCSGSKDGINYVTRFVPRVRKAK